MQKHVTLAFRKTLAVAGACAFLTGAYGQGIFFNLDFELAHVPDVPAGQYGANVSSFDGVPGWTTYIGINEVTTVLHNNISLGAASIDLLGPAWSGLGPIIQGNYTVRLQPISDLSAYASIAQIGIIPADTRTLLLASWFLPPAVYFNGQQIVLTPLGGNSSTYYTFGADISRFAGQTGELRFAGDCELDDIQFSTQPIPEPAAGALFGLAAAFVAWQFPSKKNRASTIWP
jgi:hypothetical protein